MTPDHSDASDSERGPEVIEYLVQDGQVLLCKLPGKREKSAKEVR